MYNFDRRPVITPVPQLPVDDRRSKFATVDSVEDQDDIWQAPWVENLEPSEENDFILEAL